MKRVFTVLALTPFFLTACGGGDTSMDVRKPAAERPDLEKTAAAGSLKIPAAEKFNYTSFRSGQGGNGRGESKGDGKNGAVCLAEAKGLGDAWGEFQLGYCFDNAGERALDATVKLKVRVAEKSEMKGEKTGHDKPAPTAKGTLSFFIKDSNGTALKTENLLASSLDKGPNASGTTHDMAFDARLEPGRGYYLMIAGRAEVAAGEGQSASVVLDVKEAALEIEWRPAAVANKSVAASPSESPDAAP